MTQHQKCSKTLDRMTSKLKKKKIDKLTIVVAKMVQKNYDFQFKWSSKITNRQIVNNNTISFLYGFAYFTNIRN